MKILILVPILALASCAGSSGLISDQEVITHFPQDTITIKKGTVVETTDGKKVFAKDMIFWSESVRQEWIQWRINKALNK